MEPKLIRTEHAEFIQAPYLGENRSGQEPIGDYVLVRPDAIAKKSSGGVELPDHVTERLQLAAITGVIVECGDGAFVWNTDRSRPYTGTKPKPGDRIHFEKYAGFPFLGKDGVFYRALEDKSIALKEKI